MWLSLNTIWKLTSIFTNLCLSVRKFQGAYENRQTRAPAESFLTRHACHKGAYISFKHFCLFSSVNVACAVTQQTDLPPPSLRHVHTLLLTYSRMTSVNTLTQTILHLCAGLARHLVALGAATGCGLPSRHWRGALSPQGSQQAQLRRGLSLPAVSRNCAALLLFLYQHLGQWLAKQT